MIPSAALSKKKEKTTVKKKVRVSRSIASVGLSVKQKAVLDYINCYSSDEQIVKIKTCVAQKIFGKNARSEKDRLYSWPLVFGVRLMDFNKCSKEKMSEIPFFAMATPHFECASVEVDDKVKEVVFFFKKSDKEPHKLFAIYY